MTVESIQILNAAGDLIPTLAEPSEKVEDQYAAFNDASVLEPLFTSGKLPEAMRFVIEEPLSTGTLWSVSRYARLTNEDRQRAGQLEVSGPVVVRRRRVSTTPWVDVTQDELNEALL